MCFQSINLLQVFTSPLSTRCCSTVNSSRADSQTFPTMTLFTPQTGQIIIIPFTSLWLTTFPFYSLRASPDVLRSFSRSARPWLCPHAPHIHADTCPGHTSERHWELYHGDQTGSLSRRLPGNWIGKTLMFMSFSSCSTACSAHSPFL